MLGRRSGVWLADADLAQRSPRTPTGEKPHDHVAASPTTGRAQRAVTIAAAQARVASREATRTISRTRTIAAICATAGGLGLGCSGAALTLASSQSDASSLLGFAGLALGAVPVGLLVRQALRDATAPETLQSTRAATAMATATFVDRVAEAIAEAEHHGGSSPVLLRILGGMLGAAEADADRVSKDAKARRAASPNRRRHERIQPQHRRVIVTTADGRQLIGRIADVSLSGVALSEQLPRVAVGDEVTVGRQAAVATRLWANGIAFAFKTELDPSTFGETIVL